MEVIRTESGKARWW